MKELMEELVRAMLESAKDEIGDGFPSWFMGEDLFVTTSRSRDPSRSRNGGEYDADTVFELRPDGVEVYEALSCELISTAEYKARSARLYPISLTREGLERMAHLAEARALAQIAPEEVMDEKVLAVLDAAVKLASKEIGFGEFKAAVRAL